MAKGVKIKQLREKNKMSQNDLAIKIGVAQTTIANIESERTNKIDFYLIVKLCTEFNAHVNYFIPLQNLKARNTDTNNENLSQNHKINYTEKLLDQFEKRITEKDELITFLKAQLSKKNF